MANAQHAEENLMTYKIEKNVPIPKTKSGPPPSPLRVAIEALEVGDSFGAPIEEARAARNATRNAHAATGRRYRVLAPRDADEVRVWRTE